jgi:hypothetical protein
MQFTPSQVKILQRHGVAYKDAHGNNAKLEIIAVAARELVDAHDASKTTRPRPADLHKVSCYLSLVHPWATPKLLESRVLVP